MSGFKMGSLDHMHPMVPEHYQAARWYQEKLGFEIVKPYEVWAEVEGEPLQISAANRIREAGAFRRKEVPIEIEQQLGARSTIRLRARTRKLWGSMNPPEPRGWTRSRVLTGPDGDRDFEPPARASAAAFPP